MAPHKVDPRKSIYIHKQLEAMLATGRVSGRTASQRIERLVARYNVLVREAFPKRLELTSPELQLLAEIVAHTDLTEPDAAYILPAKIQAAGDAGAGQGADASGLAYRLRNLKLGELLAVVDIVELFLGESPDRTREQASAFLDTLRSRTRL